MYFFICIVSTSNKSLLFVKNRQKLMLSFCIHAILFFRYIYTDNINLSSFELVCDICYAAKKYMLPALVEECTKFLWRDLYPRNACRAYEFAQLFDENVLMDKGLQVCNVILDSCLCNTCQHVSYFGSFWLEFTFSFHHYFSFCD